MSRGAGRASALRRARRRRQGRRRRHTRRDRDDRPPAPSGGTVSDGPLSRPGTVAAFLVGNSAQWPEGRAAAGDLALCQALRRDAGVRRLRLVVDDADRLRDVRRHFREFLRDTAAAATGGRVPCETLVVYCGGHGVPAGLVLSDGGDDATDDEGTRGMMSAGVEHTLGYRDGMNHGDGADNSDREVQGHRQTEPNGLLLWRYADIIADIENLFGGRHVLLLVDCCYSGSMALQLWRRPTPLRCSYLVLSSTMADAKAGAEWTLTGCLVNALLGQPATDADGDGRVSLRDLVAYITDQIFEVKGDVATCLVRNSDLGPATDGFHPDASFFTGRVRQVDAEWNETSASDSSDTPSDSEASMESGVPSSDSSVSSSGGGWKRPDVSFLRSPAAARQVFYHRWSGGHVGASCTYVYPAWVTGSLADPRPHPREEADDDDDYATVTLLVTAPAYDDDVAWTVRAPCGELWYYECASAASPRGQ